MASTASAFCSLELAQHKYVTMGAVVMASFAMPLHQSHKHYEQADSTFSAHVLDACRQNSNVSGACI